MRRHHVIGARAVIAGLVMTCALGRAALADPAYQLTDLGPNSLPADFNSPSASLGERVQAAGWYLPRVGPSGSLSASTLTDDLRSAALNGQISAPYTPGDASAFTPEPGTHFQAGYVVSQDPASPWQAMLWNNQTQTGEALPPAPGTSSAFGDPTHTGSQNGWFSVANGVNAAGDAVGAIGSMNNSHLLTAVVWRYGGGSADPLASVRSQLGTYSSAYDINSQGNVVGIMGTFNNPHAFLATLGGQLYDLNNLIPSASGLTLRAATGINDDGQIVGIASDASGRLHEFLLTPEPVTVPEPSTLALFGAVGLGLGLRQFAARRSRIPGRPAC